MSGEYNGFYKSLLAEILNPEAWSWNKFVNKVKKKYSVKKLGKASTKELIKYVKEIAKEISENIDKENACYCDILEIENICFNADVAKRRYKDPEWFMTEVYEFERDGNGQVPPHISLIRLAIAYWYEIFNEEEIATIINEMEVFKANKAFEEIMNEPSVQLLLGKLYRWRKNLDLEFWQGALSKENLAKNIKSIKGFKRTVNYPEEGEEYVSLLWDLRKVVITLMKEGVWHYTISERLAK